MNCITKNENSLIRHITRVAQKEIRQQTGMRVNLVLCADAKPNKTPEEMLAVIATALKMSEASYSLKSRTRNISELRFVAALFLRKHFPTITLKHIGLLFGGKDHSSILYSIDRAIVLLRIKDRQFTKKYVAALRAVNYWFQK